MSVGLLMRASSGVAVVVLALGGGAARPLADARAATDPVIAAVGDIACEPGRIATATECRHQFTSNLVAGAGLSAVLVLGDIQYEDGALAKFNASYHPTWGRVKNITRPVPGNHEYRTAGAAGYYEYFGPLAGERGKGYYSFDVGAWHVIALNSECGEVGGCGPGSPQLAWLLQDLAAHSSAACTLAYWHHPRFSSGEHGGDAASGAFWEALYEHHADLVLTGHDHDYERFAPQTPAGALDTARGIRQFVVGTGGRSLRPFPTSQPNSEIRRSDTFGVLKLTLRPTGYDWQFVPEAGKTFTDTGSASCHSPPAAPTPPPVPTADFTAAPTTGAAPLTVSFTDTSTGPPTSWAWDLDGNGAADSTLRNPTFTYTAPGRYAVTLTASNASGSNVAVKPDFVVVSGGSVLPAMRTSRRTFAPGADGSVAARGAVAPRRVLRVGGRAGYRSYVRFAAPRVRGSPTRAALRLYVTDPSRSRVTIRRCSTGWTERRIARGGAPRLVGGPLARALPGRGGRWLDVPLPIASLPRAGPVCFAIAGAGADGASFSSREGRRAPRLVVTATTPT